MAQGSKPGIAGLRLLSAAALGAPLLFLAVFSSNPVLDKAVSWVATARLGRPVRLQGVRLQFPPFGKRAYFQAARIDLLPLCGPAGSAASDFVRRYHIEKWLILTDSRWVLTRQEDGCVLRILGARAGEGSVRAGVRFEKGRLSRAAAAIWIPKDIWRRFPALLEKRFSQDARERRLFKLTWNNGRWRLWGRSAPVLEASWR